MKPRLHQVPAGSALGNQTQASGAASQRDSTDSSQRRLPANAHAPSLDVLNALGIHSHDALFSALDKPMSLLDRELRILWTNALYAELLRMPQHHVIGKTLSQIHSPDSVAKITPHMQQAFEGQTTHYDRLTLWADGTPQWMRVQVAPVRHADGHVACVLATATNIDDVIEAREEAKHSRENLQRILNAIDLPMGKWNHNAQLEDCNTPYLKWARKSREELIGRSLQELFGEDAWAIAKPAFDSAFMGDKAQYSRLLRHQEGTPHWARITVFPELSANQTIDTVYTIAFDIDAEMRAIDKLRTAQKRLDVFTENIPNAMTYFDRDYVYRFVSKAFLQRYDLKPEDIIDKKVWEARGKAVWEEYRPYAERAMSGETVEFERLVPEKDGTPRWKRIQFTPDFDDDGYVKGVYSTRIDITDIKLAQAALKRDADWDSLTSTFNRNYFNAALAQAIARADDAPFALYYLDLDGFKQVNDSMGHTVGDELLAHIAQSLKAALQADDTLARIGGDEFAVLSYRGSSGNSKTLVALAERLLRAANTPFRMGDISLSLTMSIGVVVVSTAENCDVRRLLQRADAAMYEAKHKGKNCWVRAR